MAETTEVVPANAPWLSDWKTVAKASGAYEEPVKQDTGIVETVKRAVKPWLMEWGLIAKEGNKNAPVPVKAPSTPARVDVSTEAKMKKAAIIQPHEVQPNIHEESKSNRLAELQKEIKNAKDPRILKVLKDELVKVTALNS